MARTYVLTLDDMPLGMKQAVWAPDVDGFGAMPSDGSLASLHANPAHSALRRIRCFNAAGTLMKWRLSATYPLPWDDNYLGAAHEAAIWSSGSYHDAARSATWSVR